MKTIWAREETYSTDFTYANHVISFHVQFWTMSALWLQEMNDILERLFCLLWISDIDVAWVL